MSYEEGNALETFVRAQGHTVLVRNTECNFCLFTRERFKVKNKRQPGI